MDRLGDDLTEEVIQYLTFADKVRLESVSKQWKRCVFQKEFVSLSLSCVNLEAKEHLQGFGKVNLNEMNSLFKLIDNETILDYQSLESLLKKCPNIIKVHLGFQY